MISRAPIVDAKSNLKMTQECLDKAYLSYQFDTFKIDSSFMHQILSNIFTDIHTCVYIKQRKSTQDDQEMFFDMYKWFLGLDHVARQATDAERKLQNSPYDGKKIS